MNSHLQHIVLVLLIILSNLNAKAESQMGSQNSVNLYGILYRQPHGVDGSPYLINEWSTGSVSLFNGQTATNLQLKFNILSNDLIFYNEKFKNLFIADRETVNSFTLQISEYDIKYFIKYNGENRSYKLKDGDFVHLINNGPIKFFAKYSASITEANDLNSRDKVYPKNYFYLQNQEQLSEIKLNLRSIIKIYPDRKQEIKKLASKIHFHRNSILDVSRLITALE